MTALGRVYTLAPDGSVRPNSRKSTKARLLVGGEQSEGLYTWRHYLCEEQIYLHRHDKEDENVYVLSGEPTVRVGDQYYKLSPGSFIYMPREVPHAISSDAPWEGLSVSSPGGIFDGLMDEITELFAAGTPTPEQLGAALTRAGITVLEGKWTGEAPIVQ